MGVTWGCPVTCPKCKADAPEAAQFCQQCGEPLSEHAKTINRSKNPAWAWVALLFSLAMLGFIVFHIMTDISKDSASATKPQMTGATALAPQAHFVTIVNNAATVNASSFAWYTFVVPPNANTVAVNGHFTATGGSGNDIECYILDEDGLANLKNGHPSRTYFNSGQVTQAKIGAVLPPRPGTYYIVLDNRFSLITPKAVQINAALSYVR